MISVRFQVTYTSTNPMYELYLHISLDFLIFYVLKLSVYLKYPLFCLKFILFRVFSR